MFDLSNGECSVPPTLPATPSQIPPPPAPIPGDDIAPPPFSARRDVNSDVSQIMVYREGYLDGADGRGPFRDAWAYQRGWGSGDRFRTMVSGTRVVLPEPAFPAWPIADPRKLPDCLRYYSRGGALPIKLPKFGHGGDRRSEQFKSAS